MDGCSEKSSEVNLRLENRYSQGDDEYMSPTQNREHRHMTLYIYIFFFNKKKRRAESFGFREETYLDLMKTGNFTTHFSYNFILNVKSR